MFKNVRLSVFTMALILAISSISSAQQAGVPLSKQIPDHGHNGPRDGGKLKSPFIDIYLVSGQTATCGTLAKIRFGTERSDLNDWYDNITNYRFMPTQAGTYLAIASALTNGSGTSYATLKLYKNGVAWNQVYQNAYTGTSIVSLLITNLVYLNGTTDYLEVFGTINGTTCQWTGGVQNGLQVIRVSN